MQFFVDDETRDKLHVSTFTAVETITFSGIPPWTIDTGQTITGIASGNPSTEVILQLSADIIAEANITTDGGANPDVDGSPICAGTYPINLP